MSRALFAIGLLITVAVSGQSALAASKDKIKYYRTPQYIAALSEPNAKSGSGAEAWGLWRLDPGPRGVSLRLYDDLRAAGDVAPAKWKFDSTDWWLEEHGLIMEKPEFPLPPRKYVVTGNRQVTSVLTVYPPDQNGAQRWELADGATVYDVTHLECRSARYTPVSESCLPSNAPKRSFPMSPGRAMPSVESCKKQEYAVLIVIGIAGED